MAIWKIGEVLVILSFATEIKLMNYKELYLESGLQKPCCNRHCPKGFQEEKGFWWWKRKGFIASKRKERGRINKITNLASLYSPETK